MIYSSQNRNVSGLYKAVYTTHKTKHSGASVPYIARLISFERSEVWCRCDVLNTLKLHIKANNKGSCNAGKRDVRLDDKRE
jgi:hypothetical protein